jgi:PhnB protein
MQVQAYLFFDGRCEEAIEFYRTALGANVDMIMRFEDNPDLKEAPENFKHDASCMPPPPGSAEKIMHASFRIGETTIMASDGNCTGKPVFQGVSLSITVPGDAKAHELFGKLAEGGQIQMPLEKTFFASSFGMVTDRFGVNWMIVAAS